MRLDKSRPYGTIHPPMKVLDNKMAHFSQAVGGIERHFDVNGHRVMLIGEPPELAGATQAIAHSRTKPSAEPAPPAKVQTVGKLPPATPAPPKNLGGRPSNAQKAAKKAAEKAAEEAAAAAAEAPPAPSDEDADEQGLGDEEASGVGTIGGKEVWKEGPINLGQWATGELEVPFAEVRKTMVELHHVHVANEAQAIDKLIELGIIEADDVGIDL